MSLQTAMNIHQKINSKGNLQKWLGPKSFLRNVIANIKNGYSAKWLASSRLYYKQDQKTNFAEPREPYYEGNGEFASNH